MTSGDGTASRVRVRGVYATALTARLDAAGFEVVQASPPIRRRFDAAFADAEHDVRVETTPDRQGVEVSGSADGVRGVRASFDDVGVDALSWRDRAARDAVFDARVARTLGGGAAVDLGDGREGYLPYGSVDAHVTEGDRVRVQVRDPAPPWAGDRPVVGTGLRVTGGVATLVRGVDAAVAGTPDGTADHELVRLTEMLSTDVPEGWGVRWERDADGADIATLDDALADATAAAGLIDDAVGAAGDPGSDRETARVVAPVETAWTWFGRACRFALDEVRAEVVPTMAGHHRVKAGAAGASDAVDFVERVCGGVAEFPFDAVTAQFGPVEGDDVTLVHGKPDGTTVTLGRAAVTDRDPATESITVRREMTGGGTYDGLGVDRERGDVAVTKLREGRWWYPTVYRDDGDVKGTYVNVCTPVELFPDVVRYVDLHVDVIRHADGTVETVDEDELADAVDAGDVPPALADRARDVAANVASGIGG